MTARLTEPRVGELERTGYGAFETAARADDTGL